MELFSVTCITCRAKLKVRHASAIGQILPCPRCHGMVQIEAPPGWQPPASTAVVPPPTIAPSPIAAAPLTAVPADEPLSLPAHAAAPAEARLRRWILAGGGLVAAGIVAFGFYTMQADDKLPVEPIAAAVPATSATAAATTARSSVATRPAATPSPTRPQPTAMATSSAPPPQATPMPMAIAASTALPQPSASPTPTARAVPTAVASATKPPPAPAPPPLAVPPAMIDLAARLADKLPEVAFDQTPLKQALGLLAEVSTIRISYDWDAMGDEKLVARPVTLKLADVPTGEAINRVLAECGLVSVTVGDQLVVTKPAAEGAVAVAEYDVSDLVTGGGTSTERPAALVQDFVAPETWTEAGGRGTVVAAASRLSVVQTPAVERELATFLDRLRKARGKMPTDAATTLTTRLASARDVLAKPVTMNFRPGAPLETVLAHLEKSTGAVLTVDYPALMSAGFQGTEPIGCAADKHPLGDVLSAVCGPREWSWRVVGERTIDVSTREGLRRRHYVEFYRPPAAAAIAMTGEAWVARIREQLADEGWRPSAGRGEIAFDEPSGYLIVRQHQEAHLRLEKLLSESPVVAAPEPLAPPPAATPQPATARESERTSS